MIRFTFLNSIFPTAISLCTVVYPSVLPPQISAEGLEVGDTKNNPPFGSTTNSGEAVIVTGALRVNSTHEVELVAAAKAYRIQGPLVDFLRDQNGKQWQVEGRLVDDMSIEAIKMVPLSTIG